MNVRSCCSTKMDPYRAGIDIGEGLAELDPEIIFLFPSIHYGGSAELVEAIYDVLDSDKAVLIGNTGDGFCEREKVSNAGVSALGINSNGTVKWHLASEQQASENPKQAIKQCLNKLKIALGPSTPAFYYLASDFRTDSSELAEALQELSEQPTIGGSAADDYAFQRSFVYANREVFENCVAMLAVEGEIAFDIRVAQNMIPIGNPGIITQSRKATIISIDGIPAKKFIEQETGLAPNMVDEGILTLKIMSKEKREQRLCSMLISHDSKDDGAIQLFGGVKQGDIAQVCLAPPEKIIQDINQMVASTNELPFKPVAGLVVSCAGRKKVLGDDLKVEVQEILKGCPTLTALSGFPSFGEFGPIKEGDGYSRALFHNMTCILLLLGEAQP